MAVIYVHSLPAILAFVTKIVLLLYWRGRSTGNVARTRLFVTAVAISMGLNITEVAAFQGLLGGAPLQTGAYLYNAGLIALFALLSHLAVWVAFDPPPRIAQRRFIPLVYGYAALLCAMLFGSNLVITGFELLGGYTLTRIPGPLYALFELFAVATLTAILFMPLRGIRHRGDGRLRSRCQIWTLAAVPACLLVIVVLVLLRFELKWFNASVTLPIPMALLLAAIGYCIHSKRIVDLSVHFPFSKLRRRRLALHVSLANIAVDAQRASLRDVLNSLSSTIGCPVFIANADGVVAVSEGAPALPDLQLHDIRETLITREAEHTLGRRLKQQGVGAIVPLFTTSSAVRCWLVFGQGFDTHFYTPADFEMLERVVKRVAGLLLDEVARSQSPDGFKSRRPESQSATGSEGGSLVEQLARYEASLIAQALKFCDGNKAKAARLLGLQPNTFHYKLKRHRIG